MQFVHVLPFAALSTLTIACQSTQADWNRFRGPNGSGVAEGSAPTEWSESKNLSWKAELPGAGVSSPIVVGDRVFVTCYSGYGLPDDIREMGNLARHLVCVNAKSGKKLWQKDIPNQVREDQYSGMGVPAHGYASHTPTSDGEHVYCFFGKTGVIAYDLDGNKKWSKSVGTDSDPKRWGSASSPILHENVLIVTAGPESRAIIGLDKATGEELWKAESDYFGYVWGTPAIVQCNDRLEVVVGAPYEIWALNPQSGKLTWYCEGVESDSFNTSLVVDKDMIYAIEGRRGGGGSIAVKAGGKDDISKDAVKWKGREQGGFASPVLYQGKLYHFASGMMSCLHATSGEEVFRGRLPAATGGSSGSQGSRGGFGSRGGGRGGRGGFGGRSLDYPSPVAADGKIYYLTGNGTMHVFAAGDEMNLLSSNQVTMESESFGATPAIDGGKIYLRSNKHLYCISD